MRDVGQESDPYSLLDFQGLAEIPGDKNPRYIIEGQSRIGKQDARAGVEGGLVADQVLDIALPQGDIPPDHVLIRRNQYDFGMSFAAAGPGQGWIDFAAAVDQPTLQKRAERLDQP